MPPSFLVNRISSRPWKICMKRSPRQRHWQSSAWPSMKAPEHAAHALGGGHTFVLVLSTAYPIDILNAPTRCQSGSHTLRKSSQVGSPKIIGRLALPVAGEPHYMIGFWARLSYAVRCFFAILLHAEIPQDIARALIKPARDIASLGRTESPSTAVSTKELDTSGTESVDRAVQMLSLLQRDGRLIDFLAEDVAAY